MNGANVGALGAWGALDVTDALHQGENQLAVHLMGSRWNGRIFLSTGEPNAFILAQGSDWQGMDPRAEAVPNWNLRTLRLDLLP